MTIILFKIWPTNRFWKAKSYNFHFHKNDVTCLLVQMAYLVPRVFSFSNAGGYGAGVRGVKSPSGLRSNSLRTCKENSRHFAPPPTVSPPNDVWETSPEIPYWWGIPTQVWIVLQIGWSKFPKWHAFLRSFLRRHFTEKPLLAWWNLVCFLRLHLKGEGKENNLGGRRSVHFQGEGTPSFKSGMIKRRQKSRPPKNP